MTQIKIEVPANDHIALSAMAEALQRIAAERAPQAVSAVTVSEGDEPITETTVKPFSFMSSISKGYKAAVDEEFETPKNDDMLVNADIAFQALQNEGVVPPESADHIETFEEGEKLFDAEIARMDEEREQDSTLDADGIPHDKRIHSKGATRLADNTWRLRKRPADKTEEEWTAYIDSVKAELKAVQDIPSVEQPNVTNMVKSEIEQRSNLGIHTDKAFDELKPTLNERAVANLTPPVTLTEEQAREEIKDKLDSGEVTVEAPLTPPVIEESATQLEGVTPNETPVAPVTPPTSLTPPVVEADKPSVATFQELMLYMTSDAKKRGADNDMIKATLLEVDPALTAIPLIATRADLIPKFVEALEAKLV